MAKFVKKQNGTKYYEVDGYRASGIIPYFKRGDNYYILVNSEIRSKRKLYHFLGGKVELKDKVIQDTAVREANEECGYLINSLVPSLYQKIMKENKFIKIIKSKYISFLVDIESSEVRHWLNLPELFNKMFKNSNYELKHNESLRLDWKSLNYLDSNIDKLSYLGKIIIYKLKKKFQIDSDSECQFLES